MAVGREIAGLMIKMIVASTLTVSLYLVPAAQAGTSDNDIVNAIYIAEGGRKAKVPYGILSIQTKNPRQICLNTVRNHRERHAAHRCGLDFITCLGNRYCPPVADPQGNKNWIKNVSKLLEGKK